MSARRDTPGLLWIAILGATGFAAGFFGPIVFVPEANQGPLVGILISGPAGAALGLLLWGVCSLLGVSGPVQWRWLRVIAVAGALATLVLVQPGPALRGYVYDATVVACAPPSAAEAEAVTAWRKRIAAVTWAAPAADWERDMRTAIRSAPGVLATVEVMRRKSILEARKPWNRGELSATPWGDGGERKSFYAAQSTCGEFRVGDALRNFERYDLNGRIEPPKSWPPTELEAVLDASPYSVVPPELSAL